ncbi:MAG TPA: ester cyclase [Candidatus Dormibacteraeota bacterium]|jgi:predicted ester cyclase
MSAKQVLEQAIAAFNAKDESRFVALASPSIELPSPGGLNFHGQDGFRQWFRLWTDAFPDRQVRYHNIVGDADQVLGEGTFIGTHTGPLRLPTGDVPPTGKHVTLDYVAVQRVSNGKITYLRHYLDVMELMMQLGLVGAEAKA